MYLRVESTQTYVWLLNDLFLSNTTPSTHSQVIQFNPLIISPLPWHIKKYKVNKLLIYFRYCKCNWTAGAYIDVYHSIVYITGLPRLNYKEHNENIPNGYYQYWKRCIIRVGWNLLCGLWQLCMCSEITVTSNTNHTELGMVILCTSWKCLEASNWNYDPLYCPIIVIILLLNTKFVESTLPPCLHLPQTSYSSHPALLLLFHICVDDSAQNIHY